MPRFLLLAAITVWISAAPPSACGDELSDIRRLTAQRELPAALEKLEELLERSPGHVEARLFRGVVLTRQGRVDEAIAAFAALAEEHPSLPEPQNNLAVLYASQQRYEEARIALRKAIELEPRYDTAHENLGDLYAKLASLAYRRAYRLNRDNERVERKAKLLVEAFEVEDADVGGEESETASLRRSDPGGSPPPASTPPAEGSAQAAERRCFVTGPFADEHALRDVDEWFTSIGASTRAMREQTRRAIGHRVYLPPLESRAAADVQIARMKAEGVEDIMRIAGGELDNGIALGVYSTEAAAEKRERRLRAMGYEPRRIPRVQVETSWRLEVAAPGAFEVDPGRFEESFPGSNLRATECPP